MQQQQEQIIQKEKVINIRKLAALDIVFRGPRFILIEFALGVFFGSVVGAFALFSFLRISSHPFPALMWSLCTFWIALNYVPMLLYAISIVRRKSAEREVAFELEHKDYYARKYTTQSALLVLPLIVPLLAIYQEVRKRLHAGQ